MQPREMKSECIIRNVILSGVPKKELPISSETTDARFVSCHIDSKFLPQLFNILRERNCKLNSLDLSHNLIGENAVTEINKGLQDFPTLKILNLTANGINYRAAESLIKSLSRSNLTIILTNNCLNLAEAQKLMLSSRNLPIHLEINSQDLKFDIEKNDVESAQNVLNVFPVKRLKLSKGLTDADVVKLMSTIEENQLLFLEELDLSGNQMTAVGVAAIAKVLNRCERIRSVNLANNNLSADAALACEEMIKIKSLQELNVANNKFDDSILKILLTELERASFILNVSHNNIGIEGINLLSQFADKTRHKIDFSHNPGCIPIQTKNSNTVYIQATLQAEKLKQEKTHQEQEEAVRDCLKDVVDRVTSLSNICKGRGFFVEDYFALPLNDVYEFELIEVPSPESSPRLSAS